MVTGILADGTGAFALYVLLGVAVIVGLVFVGYAASLFGLWVQAWFAGAGVRITELIGMKLRKVNPRIIVLSR
ncbi:MAG: UPF0365 family protein, partial [Anaerolineaceae bacterium]|nr:UPF0365 family protein [Anaerolineaceae bacterium]